MTNVVAVSYDSLSSFNPATLEIGSQISVRLNPTDPNTELACLTVQEIDGHRALTHLVTYNSVVEFATVTMKQILTLFVKNRVVQSYADYYSKDDPRVHSYVCKLSYEGIKHVALNVDEFARQFRSGRITMKIPRIRSDRSFGYVTNPKNTRQEYTTRDSRHQNSR